MPVYTFEVASPVVRSVRDKEPSHFKFEIESYQALLNSIARTKSDKIETSEFNAGGQSWVLVIYPNGNTRDSGSGNISLYLKLANKPTGGSSVYATFKFFIFDHERETYITIQDARERRFDAGHLEWGIAKALPVAAFNDDKNALLVNDSCTFGAEVYVISSTATVARLSLAEQLTNRSFTWGVYDYSKLRTDTYSEIFSVEERSWKLRLYPRGNLTGQGRFLSLYLYLDDRTDLTGGRKLYVECELSIRDQLTGGAFKQTVGFWFDSVNDHRGFDTFLSLADLNNPLKGYKQNDTLIVEAVINEIFVLKEIN
ncbi:Ubiquitin C-terminal hydrolase 12-like protein [Drosera capensis]